LLGRKRVEEATRKKRGGDDAVTKSRDGEILLHIEGKKEGRPPTRSRDGLFHVRKKNRGVSSLTTLPLKGDLV